MKIVIILTLAITIVSCSSSNKVSSIKLDGSNKIIFKYGDVIYFTNLDSSGISFHYTDSDSVKTKEPKDKNLQDFVIEYDSKNVADFFKPFTKQKKDSLLSPKRYVSQRYNKFADILESKNTGTFTKYRHKNLNIKKINWDSINDLVSDEIYFRPFDSLQLKIPLPKDVVRFCNEIKSKYQDAKYIILFKNVYITYNIFEGREVISTPGSFPLSAKSTFLGYKFDDALLIAPKVVIDINNARVLSIDTQSHYIDYWDKFIWDIDVIIEGEAEYYNLFF